MEAYAQVLLYAIPGFMGLILIEALYGWIKGEVNFRSMDIIASLSSGLTNTIKRILGLTIVIVSYGWVEERVALMEIEATWLVYVLAFLALDFAGYWNHRLNHSINYFWNVHIVHHSSEEFNLACALRQTISNFFGLGFIFLFPAALLGIPEEVIAVVGPLHFFLQFWYHTTYIPKLGILEYVIITPSQHRVHHAINDIYLDKNLGEIFPWWDRMFGTFQEELEDVPPVYGVKRAVRTWNPIRINFQHLWLLMQDAWRTKNIKDKFLIWFMPTGWRPEDVKDKYPIEVIQDPYTYEKYDTPASLPLRIWSWFQFGLTLFLMLDFLLHFAEIGFPTLFYYGGFFLLLVYSYTSLMDLDQNAWWIDLIKSAYGLGIIYFMDGWFVMDSWIPGGSMAMMAYLILSPVIVAGFTFGEVKSYQKLATEVVHS
ncbi:MAG: sterol desaturase family protein [Bacteroidota bacterium]